MRSTSIPKQVDDLRSALKVNGWKIAFVDADLEWWADAVWELASEWSPVGCQAFLTFMVDPCYEGDRRKGMGIEAIRCSPHRLTDEDDRRAGCSVFVRPRWKESLQQLLEALTKIRNEAS